MISQAEMMEDHNNARRMIEAHERQVRLAKNPSECQYLDVLRKIVDDGVRTPNRTGIDTLTIPHVMLQHDMKTGFPLLTTKKIAWKTMKVELQGFIGGMTDKKWYQERGCKIWDEWANPTKIPSGLSDADRKKAQLEETDLGPVYGAQWRCFNGEKDNPASDQLQSIVNTLKKNPNDRRMVCSAWNPLVLNQQALPPCHLMFNVMVVADTLHLCFAQRSCDYFLGIPYNLASYSMLAHLLAKESGFKEGLVTGFLMNVHLYVNHLDAAKEQLSREPFPLPTIETKNFKSIFEWDQSDTKLLNYQSHEAIKAEIAI